LPDSGGGFARATLFKHDRKKDVMKNQFDLFIEGQKKAMEFWTKLSEQMVKAPQANENGNGNGKKAHEAQDLFADWYQQQQAFFEQATKSMSDPAKAFQQAPEQMRQWLEMQTDFAKQWTDFYRQNVEKMGFNMPMGMNMGLPMGMNMGTFPKMYQPSEFFQEGMKGWKEWMEQSNKWMSEQFMAKMPFNMRPHYQNFIETFDFMHRYWEPIQRMIQNGLFTKDMVEKYFNPEAYRKVINQMMGFRPVGNLSDAIENANQWFENYFALTKTEMGDWASVSEDWNTKMKEYAAKGNLPFFEVASDFNNRINDQLTPFFNIMAQGRQTEIAKMMRDIQFAYTAFLLKSTELQTKAYEAGQFALPDTIRDLYQQYKEKPEVIDFDYFFNHYVNTLENAMLDILHSEEYSKLQFEVAGLGTRMKGMTDKVVELLSTDLPFLTKSEGDDFAKEVTSLRRKIRSLEERLAQMENGTETATAKTEAPAPAASASRRKTTAAAKK